MTSEINYFGSRTEFSTGAVRDMSATKGRMDLLPWQAIIELSKHCQRGAIHYEERNVDKGIPLSSLMDSAFRHMGKYMEGANDEPHLVAALWNLAWAVQFEAKMPEMQDIPNRMKLIAGESAVMTGAGVSFVPEPGWLK